MARKNNIPFGIICGEATEPALLVEALGHKHLMAITDRTSSLEAAMGHAAKYVEEMSMEMAQVYFKEQS